MIKEKPTTVSPVNDSLRLSQRAQQTVDQPIGYLMKQAVTNPNLISLAAGLVDQESLPVEVTHEVVDSILSDPEVGRRALQYGTSQGDLRLREQTLNRLTTLEGRDLQISPENVIVTTGAQQLLQIVSDVLLDPDDIVLLGAPEYFVYLGTLSGVGARPIPIAMDLDGMIPESLEEALSDLDKRGELERVKILYVGSYHQNPSGVTLSLERRPAILDIVRRWERHGRILVIDDAAYRELSYDSTSMPSLLSFDESRERVILAQTFSKSFSPGLKTGFSILPSDLMEPVLQQKGNHDFGSSNLNQQILAETLDRGHYASHVENLRRLYHEKCQVMLEAIDQEFPRLNLDAKWVRPEGGLFVWMTLPPEIETTHDSQLFQRCIENGVLYVPGEYCFATDAWEETGELGGPRSTMRLTFGTQSPEGIREGIRRLASSIAQCIEDD